MCHGGAVRALILIGPPGAGKTTVLTALMDLLTVGNVRYAAFEVESLALVHPWPDDDAAFAHAEVLARSFGERGYPLLLVNATVESPEYLRRLLDAVAPDEHFLVRLDAPPALLRERITRREPPEWTGLQRLLDAVGALAAAHATLSGVDLSLSTADDDPTAIAAAILEAMGSS